MRKLGAPSMDTLPDIARLMCGLQCTIPSVLIIDNYQLAYFEVPERLPDAFSLHNCSCLHILILTQPLPFAVRPVEFLNPRVYRMGADLFVFGREDIANLFLKAGIELKAEQTEFVLRTNGGFAVAVRLQMSCFLENGKFARTTEISFLMESAFRDLLRNGCRELPSCDCKELLLSLSVLGSFTEGQAAIMLGTDTLPDNIVRLLNGNDFIRFDEKIRAWSFHQLLRSFLFEKFAQRPYESQKKVWQKAGTACISAHKYAEAARFFIKTGDFSALPSLSFRTCDVADLVHPDSCDADGLIDNCPKEILMPCPEILLKIAMELLLFGMFPVFRRYYEMLRSLCFEPAIQNTEQGRRIQGELAFLEFFLKFNDIEAMHQAHKKAWILLQSPTRLFLFSDTWTFGVSSVVFLFWRDSGKLRDELHQAAEALSCYYRLTDGHGTGAHLAMEADILLLAGDDCASKLCVIKRCIRRKNKIRIVSAFAQNSRLPGLRCCAVTGKPMKILLRTFLKELLTAASRAASFPPNCADLF